MKNYVIMRWGSAAVLTLMGLLTLVSCGDDNEEPPVPYGEPRIAYYVKGNVTDTEGQPLQGIAMRVKEDYRNFMGYVQLDSVLTDEGGNYQTHVISDANLHDGLVLIVDDPNGVFRADTVALTELPKRQVSVGDDAMDKGVWELTANARLQRR